MTLLDLPEMRDALNRLTRAEEGTLSSGSITSRTRDQQWTLSHTGNWKRDKVDLNGDGDFVDTDEVNDTRGHNAVNELETRDTDSNSSTNYSLAYDAAGNQTDDGKDYEYVWDAFYRLRKINRTDNQALVAEYRYNGLGFKIAEHADTDTDGDVDSNDKWYFDAFDERWRQVSRFRESDTSPKEEFVAHQAGASGYGGSSYIDLVVCRYKDANTAWTSASDGTLEERLYYCQNQHADVVAIVGSDGTQREGDRYSAYGVPFGLPGGDCDSDGDCDSADVTQVQAWIDAPAYDVRGDVDLDGDVDAADKSAVNSFYLGAQLGSGTISTSQVANYRGEMATQCAGHGAVNRESRLRWSGAPLGRWASRDSAGYVDGPQLYQLLSSNPRSNVDPSGQFVDACVARRVFWAGASSGRFSLHPTFLEPDDPSQQDGTDPPLGEPQTCTVSTECSWRIRARIKLYRQGPTGDQPWTCPGIPGSQDEVDCNLWHSPPLGRAPSGPIWTTNPPAVPPRRVPTPKDNQSEWGPFGLGRDVTAKCPEMKHVCYTATSPVDASVWTSICFFFDCHACSEHPGHIGHPTDPPPGGLVPQ